MPKFAFSDRGHFFGVIAVCVFLASCANAQPAPPSDFSRLVDLSAARLEISRQVALTKWDSGFPVADPPGDPREQQVIAAAAAEAAKRGVSPELAGAFFADQIEASKLIQIALMTSWRRAGEAPTEPRADLSGQLRPALDRLRPMFIEELKATQRLRESPECRSRLANATADLARIRHMTPLFVVALDRGLARVCGD
ncbi:chorismate mutase [Variovorax sp. N23]|uniref:chorismate mutase n=1 Tax=Variovorax sp. N23 TaxID=2980555 RepID=UPI0021C85E21|nr:chorismate mutase [Variovorax sp. N23]MCU4119012.1 chorismate mutase [Variovorax sp. N23]